ncbi:unnamed protein product [Zymoseptoria tritici ST99CH_3D7]|uniref:Uncharacterized protein n=2 Tax=Zymoseptoria tritici TaxID=1047171 RepID=A0A1X7S8D3_ZYMT9|nr:unnamed protein product [Zymoseptoria tritici ST99CH_3D7]SMR61139.1 unnamed protein product [Zymoseptoria tritici ST99CH_1E4]
MAKNYTSSPECIDVQDGRGVRTASVPPPLVLQPHGEFDLDTLPNPFTFSRCHGSTTLAAENARKRCSALRLHLEGKAGAPLVNEQYTPRASPKPRLILSGSDVASEGNCTAIDVNALEETSIQSKHGMQHQKHGAHSKSSPNEISFLALILYNWLQLMATHLRLLCLLTLFMAIRCASAAPTGSPPVTDMPVLFASWRGTEASALKIGTGIAALIALVNIGCIAVRRPRFIPRLSGDIAIGLGLLIWILFATTPGEEELRNLLVSLWFLTESNYVSRVCCMASNGRAYLWGSIATGLALSMFMAALQGDTRPTLTKMILTGLPSSGFFISCAARLMPSLVGSRTQL